MNINIWAYLCLFTLLTTFQLPSILLPVLPGWTHLFSCVLCYSVPCFPVATYCVKFDTQQKLLLNKWALLLHSVVLCLVLCPGTVKIHIFLVIEERAKVWKAFENRCCNKDSNDNCWKSDQRGHDTAVLSKLLESEAHLQKSKWKHLGLPQWLQH